MNKNYNLYKNMYMKQRKKSFFIFIMSLLASVFPLLLNYLQSGVFQALDDGNISTYMLYLLVILVFNLLNFSNYYRYGYEEEEMRFNINKSLKLSLLSIITSSKNLSKLDDGRILDMLNQDIYRIEYIIPNIIDLINKFIFFILTMAILLSLNFRIGIFAITPLIIGNLIVYFCKKYYKEFYRLQRESEKDLSNYIYSSIQEINTIKYQGQARDFINQGKKISKIAYKYNRNSQLYHSLIDNGIALAQAISTFMIMLVSITYIESGQITIQTFVLFTSYIGYGFLFLNNYVAVVSDRKYVENFSETLASLFGNENIQSFANMDLKPSRENNNKFEGVDFLDFQIEEGMPRFDFSIDDNELIVVKALDETSPMVLVDAILGYGNYHGSMILKNSDQEKVVDILGFQLGYCPQDNNLFDKSLRENIIWDKDSSDIEKIYKLANIFVDNSFSISDSTNNNIGIGGNKLSQGQRQRVGIGRAIKQGLDIFIFDEAFSYIDYKNKNIIFENILNMKKTVIFVTSDDYIASKADKIIYMKANNICSIEF